MNVSIPRPLKSQVATFTYEQVDDEHVVVRDVDLFDEHYDETRDPPFDDMTGATFQAVFDCTKRFETAGAFPQVIIGHTEVDESKSRRDRELGNTPVGHVRNIRMKGSVPDRRIHGDIVFQSDFFHSTMRQNQLPRRSVELDPLDLRMDPIALLGPTTPARPLKDFIFEGRPLKKACYSRGEWTFQSQKEADMPDTDDKLTTLEGRMAKMEALFEKFVNGNDDKKDKEKKQKEDEDDEKKGEDGKEQSSGERVQFDRQLRDMKSEYDRKLQTQSEQLEQYASRAISSEVDNELDKLSREGIRAMGDKDARENIRTKLVAMRDEKRRAECYDEIRKHYAKVPVGERIDRTGVLTLHDDDESPKDVDTERYEAAKKRSEKEGIPLWQAMQKVG